MSKMIIDLGLEDNKVVVDTEASIADLADGYYGAVEAMATADLENSLLTTAVENLEHGMAVSKGIADKTGDANAATVAGIESLRSSLAIIGQDSIVASMDLSATDMEGAVEAADNIMAKMWAKTKEYAKKIWEFIRNLVIKATTYVKGLFGKGNDTAESILEAVKKAKKDKRTSLNTDSFEDNTAQRLAKGVNLMAAVNGADKDITVADILTFIEAQKTIINGKDKANDKAKLIATMLSGAVGDTTTRLTDLMTKAKATPAVSAVDLGKLFAEIVKEIVGDISDLAITADKAYEEPLKDAIDDSKGFASSAGKTPTKAYFVAVTMDDDSYTAYTALEGGTVITGSDAEKMTKLRELVKDLTSGLKAKVITLNAEDIDGKFDFTGDVETISISDAENIAKKLKEAGKNAGKIGDRLTKTIEQAEKDISKAISTWETGNSNPTEVTMVSSFARKIIDIQTTKAKGVAQGMTDTMLSCARSPFGAIVTESIRLYEK